MVKEIIEELIIKKLHFPDYTSHSMSSSSDVYTWSPFYYHSITVNNKLLFFKWIYAHFYWII